MSVVKINAISVPVGYGPTLEARFAARASLVEGMPGFERFELLRPVSGDDRYFVVTHWADNASFQAWVGSDQFRQGHTPSASDGGASAAPHAQLLEFEVVGMNLVSTQPAQPATTLQSASASDQR